MATQKHKNPNKGTYSSDHMYKCTKLTVYMLMCKRLPYKTADNHLNCLSVKWCFRYCRMLIVLEEHYNWRKWVWGAKGCWGSTNLAVIVMWKERLEWSLKHITNIKMYSQIISKYATQWYTTKMHSLYLIN